MYLCLNYGTVNAKGLSFEQKVQLAADAGFEGADAELGYAQQHGVGKLRDLYATRNLKFGGWGVPFDWRGEDAKVKEGLPNLEAQAKIAKELGIDSCATWILPSSDLPFIENWNFHVSRLKPVAKALADHGLRFGLEFCAPYHLRRMKPHEFVVTMGQMLELADAVGPNVGLLVDCFHVNAAGDSWEQLAKILGNRIVLAHLNDAPNVPITQIKDGERLLPGDGALDLKAFLQALKQTGYLGPISLEVFNADLRAMDPNEAAKKAWAATKKVADAAGIASRKP